MSAANTKKWDAGRVHTKLCGMEIKVFLFCISFRFHALSMQSDVIARMEYSYLCHESETQVHKTIFTLFFHLNMKISFSPIRPYIQG